ncbi:iron-containing alcohol dehydrogenase [Bartonella choladocola]|uniref:Alcohol dehydrogenase, class IV n=1 Tax=Bartonella choladocola TaxID=2750995 RepID=A0A1U9MKI5_9HYPH|nr:iron-containing alcohol dehydrogenase [Bartonella choladocola]AQT48161.1 Alcohol dehydrogenase, class IV [Bartonella choladocola]
MTIANEWTFPTDILLGPKSLAALGSVFEKNGVTAIMVLTDRGLSQSPALKKLLKRIDKLKLPFGVFSSLDGTATRETLELTVRLYLSGGFNAILAFGGGATMDLAKMTRLFCAQGANVKTLGSPSPYTPLPPLIAVPTLAGSGAEISDNAYLIDNANNNSFRFYDKRLTPTCVIADPVLTGTAPASFIAGAAMNALTNAIDSWCIPSFNPVSDALALETVRLVFNHLPKAVSDPSNNEAQIALLSASLTGALAAKKGSGITSALARSIGNRYQTHFGMTAGVLLPYVIAYNQSAVGTRISTLAERLNIKGGFNGFVRHLLSLRKSANIPTKLAGLTKDQKIKAKDKALIESVAVEDQGSDEPLFRLTKKAALAIVNAAIAGKMNRKK